MPYVLTGGSPPEAAIIPYDEFIRFLTTFLGFCWRQGIAPQTQTPAEAEWQAVLRRQDATTAMFHVTRLLREHPILTAQDVMDHCTVSHQTAMWALQRLEALGILQKMDERLHNQQFMASRIVEIAQRP